MGTYALADALTRVYRTLRDLGTTADAQLLTNTEMADYIEEATARYSSDRPAELVEDVVSDGTRYLAVPTLFEDGYSVIRSIEYPIGYELSSYLDPRDVDLYRTPVGAGPAALNLRLGWGMVENLETVRITFTGRRVFGAMAADTTVLDRDFAAVCNLAVSACCDAIAQKYARAHEPVLNADSVAFRDKVLQWESRAKRYEARYHDAIGPRIASGVVNWDSNASWRNGEWMTHPRYRR